MINNRNTMKTNKPRNTNIEFDSFKSSFIKRLNDSNYNFSESDITIWYYVKKTDTLNLEFSVN